MSTVTAASVWDVPADQRTLYPALVAGAIVIASLACSLLPGGLFSIGALSTIVIAGGATLATQSLVDRQTGWMGLNDPKILQQPVVLWARKQAGPGHKPSALRVEPYLVFVLHFAAGVTSNRLLDVGRMPDLPDLIAELRRYRGRDVAFIVTDHPPTLSFACGSYQKAYEEVLATHADSTMRGPDFSVWWVPASTHRIDAMASSLAHLRPSC